MQHAFHALTALLFVMAGALAAGEDVPRIVHVGTVAPDILGITVDAQHVTYGPLEPYTKQPGDETVNWHKGIGNGFLKRDGKELGGLVGPGATHVKRFDELVGKALDTVWADRPESYSLSSEDDANYQTSVKPTAVYRKSKPSDIAQLGSWKFECPATHVIYLCLPKPLVSGKTYQLAFSGGALPQTSYTHAPAKNRSEAVHVSQLGYRPDDPAKVAFLSIWLGNGGKHSFAEGLAFQVLDNASGAAAFGGKTILSKRIDQTEDPYKKNYNGTDVYLMDFSALDKPGTYRVSVEGIGCSYPFEIAPDAWRKAFTVAARGFYHQRSGIELGPPYTDFKRPRCFHPDDGVKVYQSTCPLMDSGNGLNAKGTDKGNFGNLVKGKTDEIVSNAWGGYFDAGDWDRRIQHLEATRLLLELCELFPDYVKELKLKLPESGNGMPDLLNEALWNIDFFQRIQAKEGGIRGGIESSEHPQFGEASWQNSLANMAYAPDPWCSFIFAGDATRAARVVAAFKPDLAKAYRASALKAMEWGEVEYAKIKDQKLPHPVADARCLAAAELFRDQGDERWHKIFMETTVFADPKNDLYVWQHHDQRDVAFVYARTDRPGMNEDVKRNARNAILREADVSLTFGQGTGFRWTKMNPWQPASFGVLGVSQATTIVRAHVLTGDAKYLRAAVLSSQSAGGANPVNMCYTTGLGSVSPQHPLDVDQRVSGQKPAPGITVYGPMDHLRDPNYFTHKLFAPVLYPSLKEWPVLESYFEVWIYPVVTEFTVMQNLGPNTYVWGYLAARK